MADTTTSLPTPPAKPAKGPPELIDWNSLWNRLKLHIARRHDYFEKEYTASNFAADEAQMAFYRSIFQTMRDMEEGQIQSSKKA